MYDFIAIGNALVDTEFELNEEILAKTGIARGSMTLAEKDAQNALFSKLASHQVYSAKKQVVAVLPTRCVLLLGWVERLIITAVWAMMSLESFICQI